MDHIRSIVSWNINNINGLLGPKTDDPDFINITKNHSVICLQEIGNDVNIPGFHAYSDLRKVGKNGGVTTLVSNKLRITSSEIDLNIPSERSINILVIKFSNPCGRDIYIINVYIPPHNSKRKIITTNSENNFDILQETVNKFVNIGDIIVCGDLNARIGLSNDIDKSDNSSDFLDVPSEFISSNQLDIPPNIPISIKRNCQDRFTNSHKSHLLDLVRTNSLLILNGRTLGDSSGNYTCYNWNGNSVVDYFICSQGILPLIRSLHVEKHTIYSDHNPVVLSMWSVSIPYTNTSNQTKFNYAPYRYKINEDSLNSFKEALQESPVINTVNKLLDECDNCDTSDDIKTLNCKVTDLLNNIASKCFDKTKNAANNIKPKYNAWFDKDCRTAKRQLNKSCRITSKHPDNKNIKLRHRQNKKSYRKLIKSKKDRFFDDLNKKIKNGKILSWNDFKKVKKFTKSDAKLDDEHIDAFQHFYENLYSDEHNTIDSLTKQALFQDANNIANSSTPNRTLNNDFTMDELNAAICRLKNGKASSFDHIPNEIIKALDGNFRKLILKLFNICLNKGVYLWNDSVITPLHKKGKITNPDNYRAIGVCSCIGKLLSSMLLERLICHRSMDCPDPPNQCGFTKGSQCNDHIFTLHTIMEKYKRIKKKVYTAFIDLRKAFDLVCRQALLYKLACYGVNGGFFNLLRNMYSDSSGHIKINGKISESFNIMKGTEQGHPLSPELFKVYFKDLSDKLNSAITNCPTLSGLTINHLAWADDLVILALDLDSLQKLLDIISSYCDQWGLEVNVGKTKYMVLNSKVNQYGLHTDPVPTINGLQLERVTSYCYLGIIISSNGSFKSAVDSLNIKGRGALFSLRRTIDRRYIDVKCHDKLFDALVKPILTYGCQIWLPLSAIMKLLTKSSSLNADRDKIIKSIARQPFECTQLRHIKYMLGINRRSSNTAAWGETGKFPIIIGCARLCINYFKRIINLPNNNFTKAAITEQIQLNLPWYDNIKKMVECFDDISPKDYQISNSPTTNAILLSDLCSSATITGALQELFLQCWRTSLVNSSKLEFYRSIKSSFAWENYLDHIPSFLERRSTARIRCSSHKLQIEIGRYSGIDRANRVCKFCLNTNKDIMIENEDHILNSCPHGTRIRQNYQSSLKDIFKSAPLNYSYIPMFNIAETYPIDINNADNSKVGSLAKIIKLAGRTIHRLYENTMKFNNELDSVG